MTALGSESAIDDLFEASPAIAARTTPAATLSLLCAVAAVAASPWSTMLGGCALLAVLALVLGVVGLAKASRRGVAGAGTSAFALVLALAAGAMLGLRYVGVDTAVGDGTTLWPLLEWLSALLPTPPTSAGPLVAP